MDAQAPMDVDRAPAPRAPAPGAAALHATRVVLAVLAILSSTRGAHRQADRGMADRFSSSAADVAALLTTFSSGLNYADVIARLAAAGMLLPPSTRRPQLARTGWEQSSLNLILTEWPGDVLYGLNDLRIASVEPPRVLFVWPPSSALNV